MPTIKLTAQELLDLDMNDPEAIKPYIINDSEELTLLRSDEIDMLTDEDDDLIAD